MAYEAMFATELVLLMCLLFYTEKIYLIRVKGIFTWPCVPTHTQMAPMYFHVLILDVSSSSTCMKTMTVLACYLLGVA
jgi:hypothetical protein